MWHLDLFVPPGVLDKWGITYEIFEQKAGECIVTGPGVYHQGWNEGPNIAEAINFEAEGNEWHNSYLPCHDCCWPDPSVFEEGGLILKKDGQGTEAVMLKFKD